MALLLPLASLACFAGSRMLARRQGIPASESAPPEGEPASITTTATATEVLHLACTGEEAAPAVVNFRIAISQSNTTYSERRDAVPLHLPSPQPLMPPGASDEGGSRPIGDLIRRSALVILVWEGCKAAAARWVMERRRRQPPLVQQHIMGLIRLLESRGRR